MSVVESVTRVRGHNIVSTKALVKVAEAAAAEFLRVSPQSVQATVIDSAGSLVLRLQSPVRMAPLGSVVESEPLANVLARARKDVSEKFGEITGRTVSKLELTITGAEIHEERRVL